MNGAYATITVVKLFIGREKEINEQTQITLKHCLQDRVFVDKDSLVYYRGLFLVLLSAFPYFLLPDLCLLFLALTWALKPVLEEHSTFS